MSTENEERHSACGIMAGFALGLMGGAVLALLFTPTRGRDTRAWVRARGEAAGRRTVQMLRRSDAVAIVRRRGIRGLVEVLRASPPASSSPTVASGD